MDYRESVKLIFKEKLKQRVERLNEKSKGQDNIIYLIRTNNSDLVIRIPRLAPKWMSEEMSDVVKNRLSAEAYANDMWSKLGVPVPKTILLDTSRELVDFDYLIQEQIKGRDMGESKLTLKQKQEIMLELGKYVKKMHSVETKKYGYMKAQGVGDSKTWSEFIDKDFNGNFNEIKKHNLLPKRIQNKIASTYSNHKNILSFKTPKLLHTDLGEDNIIIYKGKLSGIIDMSDINSGDPMYELGVMSNYYFGTNLMDSFYKGYGKINIRKVLFYAVVHSMWMINFHGNLEKNKKWLSHDIKSLKYHLDKLS